MQEILTRAVSGRGRQRNTLVGDQLQGSVAGAAADQPLILVGPNGESERIRLQVDGEDARWTYEQTYRSGIYEASLGEPLNESRWYGVNVDTRESDLERYDPELLPNQFNQDFQLDSPDAALPAGKPAQYFRYFLAAVLVLLLVETFLAWRFGNRTT